MQLWAAKQRKTKFLRIYGFEGELSRRGGSGRGSPNQNVALDRGTRDHVHLKLSKSKSSAKTSAKPNNHDSVLKSKVEGGWVGSQKQSTVPLQMSSTAGTRQMIAPREMSWVQRHTKLESPWLDHECAQEKTCLDE